MKKTLIKLYIVIFLSLLATITIAAESWRDNLPIRMMFVPQKGMHPTIEQSSLIFVKSGFLFSAEDISRGNIVSFRKSENDKEYIFIWRVIGLPGDRVVTDKNDVILNGKYLYREPDESDSSGTVFREFIGDINYRISLAGNAEKHPYQEITVPNGYLFVLGDNRNAAKDSRYIGLIPIESVIGIKIF
ncbi:signal peptidase I [Thalassolituus hydrocarboniclasticus]|uniref:Signal peptidase I n=1 Tax=Thalassolituus hydrocarboniclasticus TaxID=2742796 RepID=A0ABY6ADA3_9GAMM|nr:signal peptidase I [Thalassolituus hydrocarboniclasticus]UXD88757.1 signal peptidase I [Thalassolituus hydrocarboniclasticus]